MSQTVSDLDLDLMPREEALARLREILDALGKLHGSRIAPRTIAESHLVEHGHRLAFGCCRPASPAD